MKLRYNPRIFLSLFFMAIAAYALVQAQAWPFNVRLFPTLASAGLFAFSLVQLVRDSVLPASVGAPVMDFEFAEGVDPRVARRRTLVAVAWVLGFVLSVWLLGFYIAIPALVFLYMRFQGKDNLVLSVALAAVAFFFWGLFNYMLHVPVPEPRLFAFF